jgi:transcriptional regulator with XRE-family HTH domain
MEESVTEQKRRLSDLRKGFAERVSIRMCEIGIKPSASPLMRLFNATCSDEQQKITRAAAWSWLQGTSLPSKEKFDILTEGLGTTPEYLLYGVPPPPPLEYWQVPDDIRFALDFQRLNSDDQLLMQALMQRMLDAALANQEKE